MTDTPTRRIVVSVRVDTQITQRIFVLRRDIEHREGSPITTSDLLREAIALGLAILEAEHGITR